MSNFDAAVQVILKHEGGYVNNVNDSGGATNFGVSLRFLAEHPDYGDFNHDGVVDAKDIRGMTVENAKDIYRHFWWEKYGYGNIEDQTIATKVFDFSVNMGASRAHKLLQQAINEAFGDKLVVDGMLGKASFGAINSRSGIDDQQLLINAYCEQAWKFYQGLIRNNAKLAVFQKGWKNRAYSINTAQSLG